MICTQDKFVAQELMNENNVKWNRHAEEMLKKATNVYSV